MDISEFVQKKIEETDANLGKIRFEGYEFATCTSINDENCQGFPLKDGDLVSAGTVVNYKGSMADSCCSYIVGEPSD